MVTLFKVLVRSLYISSTLPIQSKHVKTFIRIPRYKSTWRLIYSFFYILVLDLLLLMTRKGKRGRMLINVRKHTALLNSRDRKHNLPIISYGFGWKLIQLWIFSPSLPYLYLYI